MEVPMKYFMNVQDALFLNVPQKEQEYIEILSDGIIRGKRKKSY